MMDHSPGGIKGSTALAGFAVGVLGLMILVTVRASLVENVVSALVRFAGDPWAVATLADAYCGFLWFYGWLAWVERGWIARLAWLPAILALGNIAMAVYVLMRVARLRHGFTMERFLVERSTPRGRRP